MKFLTYSFTLRYPASVPGIGMAALRGLPEVADEHVAMQVADGKNTFEAYEKFRLVPSPLQMYRLHGTVSQAGDVATLHAHVRPSIRKVVSVGAWLALISVLLGALPSAQLIAFFVVSVSAVIWVELRMVTRATRLWQHAARKTLWLQGTKTLN